MTLTNLSTKALLEGLTSLLGTERRTVARFIAHLIEVEERRVHLEEASPSLFDYCVRKLGLSEGEAFRRINAARLARRFPAILGLLEDGSIHMTALVLLRDHLTDDNHVELLAEASGRSKIKLQELLARRFPRPDVQASIRTLPTTGTVDSSAPPSAPAPRGSFAPKQSAIVEPLAEARYRVQLTASAALNEKLDRARRLMSHRCPDGDLAVVIERALDLLISSLEKDRLGRTTRAPAPRAAKPAHVTRAVRREVVARDGEQCTFANESGERCPAKDFLEFDHRQPRALGGTGETSNVRLLCRAHNRLEAERRFGREHVAEKIRLRRSMSAGGKTEPAVFVLATRALTKMGFRATEADAAIRTVRSRHEAEAGALAEAPLPVFQDVLRSALRVLCPH